MYLSGLTKYQTIPPVLGRRVVPNILKQVGSECSIPRTFFREPSRQIKTDFQTTCFKACPGTNNCSAMRRHTP